MKLVFDAEEIGLMVRYYLVNLSGYAMEEVGDIRIAVSPANYEVEVIAQLNRGKDDEPEAEASDQPIPGPGDSN